LIFFIEADISTVAGVSSATGVSDSVGVEEGVVGLSFLNRQ